MSGSARGRGPGAGGAVGGSDISDPARRLTGLTLGAAAREALDLRANITMICVMLGPDSLKRERSFGIGDLKCEVF